MGTTILKLGGSLLTDKSKPFSLRHSVIKQMAKEIAEAYYQCVKRLVVIHGGGSFGHYVVSEHGGVDTRDAIFQTIWFMRELNMVVTDALISFGVPAVPFDTHALSLVTQSGIQVDHRPIAMALEQGLVPVLYGDVVFGEMGAMVLSGDEIAWYLSRALKPSRLLFATTVDGVYDKPPSDPSARLLSLVTLNDIKGLELGGGVGFDVTGGMKTKLVLGLKYADRGITEVLVFNGLKEGHLLKAICGYSSIGTAVKIC